MKKRKRPVARAPGKEGEAPETQDPPEEAAPHPGVPHVMVTWHGSEGSEQLEAKIWHGTTFKIGEPVAVDHLNWRSICADIDAGGPEWSYEYVIGPPPEPEPAPKPVQQPAKQEEPSERSRSSRR